MSKKVKNVENNVKKGAEFVEGALDELGNAGWSLFTFWLKMMMWFIIIGVAFVILESVAMAQPTQKQINDYNMCVAEYGKDAVNIIDGSKLCKLPVDNTYTVAVDKKCKEKTSTSYIKNGKRVCVKMPEWYNK